MTVAATKLRFDVILFDIDNVLVDTRSSYLAAIQETVDRYLGGSGLVSAKDVDRFKLLGGFNDDWDCCYGIIAFLETAIQGKPIRFGDHRRQRLFISELPDLFPERPLGIDGLFKRLRVLYERVETPSYKKIAQIFQEVYLGKGKIPGLIQKERPIFPKSILEKIRRRGVKFGIVTGRNNFEAGYALKRFGIRKLFDVLITIDEVKRAEKKTGKVLRKPDPWPILEAAKIICRSNPPWLLRSRRARGPAPPIRFLYVGDLPDDILAAKQAGKYIKIKAAGFPKYTRDLETALLELQKVKPDFILKKPRDLLLVIARRRSY